MTKIKTLGLALVAAFAMSAMAVSAASAALPEFATTGLTLKAKGTNGKLVTESKLTETIECATSEANTEVETTKAVKKFTVVYKKCKTIGSAKCAVKSPAPAAAEEIVTKEVVGELNYVVPLTEKKTGLVIKPVSGPEFVEVIGTCIPLGKAKVTGATIGEVTPLNTATTTGSLVFAKGAGESQQWTEYENEAKEVKKASLSAFGFKVWLETTEGVTFGATETVKA